MARKIRYTVNKVRFFENARGMIGHVAEIHKDGLKIGETTHDGDCLVYSIRFISTENELEFKAWAPNHDVQEGVDALLTAYENALFPTHPIVRERTSA